MPDRKATARAAQARGGQRGGTGKHVAKTGQKAQDDRSDSAVRVSGVHGKGSPKRTS